MLWSIASAFIVLWLMGMVTSTMIGGFIHFLMVFAVSAIALSLFRGKKRRQYTLMAVPRKRRIYRHFTERGSLRIWR